MYITKEEFKGVQRITRWAKEYATDPPIYPMKDVAILYKSERMRVDCNVKKPSRQYSHLTWLENEKKRINNQGDVKAFIVKDGDYYSLAVKSTIK